ncbi:hypothetical protein DTO027B5_2390 [Paecilomyces variotii]|nr:hypothetical protein DTO169C6_2666 [Paecilomyces variotii]KAJ9288156.1 hypothetical protein DTO021C3_4329 [Paecilomyces variotii]KAJ9329082.1 hypothetical protein DTO027B3_482 [Paecilomyces variotii]KAJ9335797.1 hypothetical protein DTO027B5_2390 [Paecilomyces variotii]
MPKGKHKKSKAKAKAKAKNKATLEEYIEMIPEDGVRFYWDPRGLPNKAHGDNKSSTGGVFQIQTMETSESPPQYVVSVLYKGGVVIRFSMGTSRPSDKDVVTEVKKRAGVA